MSTLRARCPDCSTLTTVAIGTDYECHVCGREFAAGLVRVPRAWGTDGASPAAATLALPYPEASVVDEETLERQSAVIAADLPARPVVLGGCHWAHVGAVRGLARRYSRLAVVWIDARDLGTPAGPLPDEPWSTALRTLLDDGTVAPADVCLVGAQLATEAVAAALAGADAVYVALDTGALDGDAVTVLERLLRDIAGSATIAGVGISGLLDDPRNVAWLTRLLVALGL